VHRLLAATRYIWLRNRANPSERQRTTLEALPLRHLKTARAYRIWLAFQELYQQPSAEAGGHSSSPTFATGPRFWEFCTG
jgi:transposase